MKSVKNLFLGTLLTALVFTGCDQGLGVSGGGLPALTGAAAISGTLQVDETLTAEFTPSEGQAAAVDLLEKHYQWQRKAAAEDAAWANIDEAVSAVYTLAPDDEGKYIQVLVTVTGYGGAVTGSREETVAQGGPVSTPTAHPSAGEVDSGSTVTLSTGTTGATIHYTTDGGTPTAASAQYTSAIPITAATTIKAIAVKAGRADSGMLTAAYTIVAPGTVAQPSADPPAGAVNSGTQVTLSTTTSGATIYYTTDGEAPTTGSTQYTAAIPITAATTIKAIAVKAELTNSSVLEAAYTVKAAKPVADPAAGLVDYGATVTLSTTTSGATIYYTTNGDAPTDQSTQYTAAIPITAATTIKAIAVKSGWADSDVLEASYTVKEKVATPVATPAAGAVASGTTVTLSTTTSGATIHYTTDGSPPTGGSTTYTGAITINAAVTIKAIAVKTGGTDSDVLTAAYTISGGGQGGGGSLTADVSYVPTNDAVTWESGAWTGTGAAEETWGLTVTEMPVVYFSVQKTAGQTITVGGTDEGLVEMAETGQTWDEATASDTLAVFKVNANKVHNGKFPGGAARESDGKTEADVYDEWYDSTFEGDDFQFTLNVSESGKDGKTVTVNLKQKVDLSTAAVFIVKEDHTLERQTGIKRFTDISDAGMNSHKVNFDDSPGTRLIDMLVWVDQNLDNNTEYLVRVVANEEMWPVYITYTREGGAYATSYPSVATGRVRLRGAGSTPRVIKSIQGATSNKVAYKYFKYYGQDDGRSLISNSSSEGFITLYHGGMLQLEKNITITGNGDNNFPWVLIYLKYAHLVMKDGAALGPHTGNKPDSTAVYLLQDKKDRPWARFTMEGGSIANFIGPGSPIFSSGTKNTYPGIFIKTGGTLTSNTNIVDSTTGNDGSKVNHMYFSTTKLKSLGKDTNAVSGGTNASVEITGNGSYPAAQ